MCLADKEEIKFSTLMELNMWEKYWDTVKVSTMIMMALSMMANGTRIRNMDREKCYSKMGLSMMDYGKVTKWMEKEYSYLLVEIDMKVVFQMDWKKEMVKCNTITEIHIKDNGEMIHYGGKGSSNLEMEIFMRATL